MAECLEVLSSDSETQEMTECRSSESYMDSHFDQRTNTFHVQLMIRQDFTDVKEVVSIAQVLVGNALTSLLPQSSDKEIAEKTIATPTYLSSERRAVSVEGSPLILKLTIPANNIHYTHAHDGDATEVVNTSQQWDKLLQAIDVLSAAGAGNLNMANDSEEAEVNCLMKNSHIKLEEGATVEIESSETDIGNKSKKNDINFERGPINLTMEKDSTMTLSSNNKIGNNVSETAKVDITSKGIDIVLKQKSEMVITEEMNIANNTHQAEVVIKTDHQTFECGEGAKVKLVSGTGGLNTALQQEHQWPESEGNLVHTEEPVWGANAFRVVLLGNTKSGKSSTGNTIIDRQMNANPFGIWKRFKSSTLKCQTEKNYVNGFHMTVTDTPGLWNTELTFDEVFSEIFKSMDSGPHAILLVIRLGTKFTDEDAMSYVDLKWLLGDSVHKYIIVVFAGVDQVGENERESNEEMKKEMKIILQDSPNPLHSLLSDVEHRYIAFNNKAKGDVNDRQREKLFKMIEQMVRANNGRHFELQRKHSFDRLHNYHITDCSCSCCGFYIPHQYTRSEVHRWYGMHLQTHNHMYHSCDCCMRCNRNIPHACTKLRIENTNDQESLQRKRIESTNDQESQQRKRIESTNDQESLQSKMIESTKNQMILPNIPFYVPVVTEMRERASNCSPS